MLIRKVISAIATLALTAGCAVLPRPHDVVQPALVAPYRLDSGDELRVIVFGQEDLSNTYAVDQGGVISVPLIGAVEARDRTTAEVEADIAAKLRAGYLRRPDVSVEVERYRPFFAMGEVNAAGQYSYVTGMTVQSAVAIAGGFSPRADQSKVRVTRSFNGQVETAYLKLTDPVMPGDTLYVRERFF
jgi:polysaccharide biosynthesis/export protein